jgi:hypothetical protein
LGGKVEVLLVVEVLVVKRVVALEGRFVVEVVVVEGSLKKLKTILGKIF